jgi:hypothetical protein
VGVFVYCVRGYWCTWLCNVVWICKVCFRGACFYVYLPFSTFVLTFVCLVFSVIAVNRFNLILGCFVINFHYSFLFICMFRFTIMSAYIDIL